MTIRRHKIIWRGITNKKMARKKNNANSGDPIENLLNKYEGTLFKGNSEELFYERIPFGITTLDSLIGGGIPKKRITLLAGQSLSLIHI